MKLRAWFSDQFGGIKEGLDKHSFVAAVLWQLDRKAGLRGAFGRRRSNLKVDRRPAQNAARGPRPLTWWKAQRGGLTPVTVTRHYEIYTRPDPRDLHAEKEAMRKAAVKKAKAR